MTLRCLFQSAMLTILGGLAATGFAAESRLPPPDRAALTAAEQTVEEAYGTELSKARRPPDKQALARKLLLAAEAPSNTPAATLALANKARQLAIESGDVDTVFATFDLEEMTFETSTARERIAAAETLLKSTRKASDKRKLAKQLLPVLLREFTADHTDIATQANELILSVAKSTGDSAEQKACAERGAFMQSISDQWHLHETAQAALQKDPQDAAAHSQAGEFICFRKGNWPVGLTHLAAGQPGILKELAVRDLANPEQAADQLSLGDAWWDAAAGQPDLIHNGLRLRALHWYVRVAPHLDGLDKARVEKRLTERDRGPVTMLLSGLVPLESIVSDAVIVLPFSKAPRMARGKSFITDESERPSPIEVQGAQWVPAALSAGGFQFLGSAPQAPEPQQQRLAFGEKFSGLPTGDFTISVWCLPETTTGTLIGSGQKELWQREWYLSPSGFFWRWVAGKSSGAKGEAKAELTIPAVRGAWQHLLITRQGPRVTAYLDGRQVAQSTDFAADEPLPIYGNGLTIGSNFGNAGKFARWNSYSGLIDELAVWPRPLSHWEIDLLYRAGRSRQSLTE